MFYPLKVSQKERIQNYQFRFSALVNLSHISGCRESSPIPPQGFVYLLTRPELPSTTGTKCLSSPFLVLQSEHRHVSLPMSTPAPSLNLNSGGETTRMLGLNDAGARDTRAWGAWDSGRVEQRDAGVQRCWRLMASRSV